MPKIPKLRDETKYRLLPPLDAETYAGLKAIPSNGVAKEKASDQHEFATTP